MGTLLQFKAPLRVVTAENICKKMPPSNEESLGSYLLHLYPDEIISILEDTTIESSRKRAIGLFLKDHEHLCGFHLNDTLKRLLRLLRLLTAVEEVLCNYEEPCFMDFNRIGNLYNECKRDDAINLRNIRLLMMTYYSDKKNSASNPDVTLHTLQNCTDSTYLTTLWKETQKEVHPHNIFGIREAVHTI